MIIIIFYIVMFIIAAFVVVWSLGMISAILPFIIGGAIILGLIWLIFLVLNAKEGSKEQSVEEYCKTSYSNNEDVKRCIKKKKGGD